MTPITSTEDNPSFGNDQIHPDIIVLSRYISFNQLKIMTDANQPGAGTSMLQKPVIIPLAITDAVPAAIKGNPWNNNQIRRLSLQIDANTRRLQNPEMPPDQLTGMLNLTEYHMMAKHLWVKYPFAQHKRALTDKPRIHFIVNGRIQRHTVSGSKCLQIHQIILGLLSGGDNLFITERPTTGQHEMT